jgi:hypothetical protein
MAKLRITFSFQNKIYSTFNVLKNYYIIKIELSIIMKNRNPTFNFNTVNDLIKNVKQTLKETKRSSAKTTKTHF